jgi:hypothetical protein
MIDVPSPVSSYVFLHRSAQLIRLVLEFQATAEEMMLGDSQGGKQPGATRM